MYGIVYLTTCLANGKIYVGQTTSSDPLYIGSGRKIIDAVKRYGIDSFKRETLKECDNQKQLDAWELVFIKKLRATDPKIGYNILPGSATGFGQVNPAKLPEVRKRMSKKAKLRGSNRTGTHHSEEAKRKMSKARQKYKHLDEEWKEKISESCKGINVGIVRTNKQRTHLSKLKVGGRFINNGTVMKYLNSDESLPKGWKYGRLKRSSI